MTDQGWLALSKVEAELVISALAAFRSVVPDRADEIDQLASRARAATTPLTVTVGVYGGAVQWTRGNPFPIRIIDYDGDSTDLPDRDDEDHPCSIWTEPPDASSAAST